MSGKTNRTLSAILCLAIILSLAACGTPQQSSSLPESTSLPALPIAQPEPEPEPEANDTYPWFADEPAMTAEDLADIEFIEACRQEPVSYTLVESPYHDELTGIAFTDGRFLDFEGDEGDDSWLEGDVVVSLDGRMVCRSYVTRLPAWLPNYEDYAVYNVLHASFDGAPLQLVTNDYVQYEVLKHKNLIFYIRNTEGDSGFFSWSEGQETRLFGDADAFACSANSNYVLLRDGATFYILETATKEVAMLPDLGLEAMPDIRLFAISNDGSYIYYFYADSNGEQHIVCAQFNKGLGTIEIVGEASCGASSWGSSDIILNYDGAQAIIQMDGYLWAFSPRQGFRKVLGTYIIAFIKDYPWLTQKNDFALVNNYTCAVASLEDVYLPLFEERPANLWDYAVFFYNQKAEYGVFPGTREKGGWPLYSCSIIDGAAVQEELFAQDTQGLMASADNTKIIYLANITEAPAYDEPHTAKLWCKDGRNEPQMLADTVCYGIIPYTVFYPIISPDGSKILYITDFDVATMRGKLMMIEDGGEAKLVSSSATCPVRIDNEGRVLFTQYTHFEPDPDYPAHSYDFYNLYQYSASGTVLLAKDIDINMYRYAAY